VPDLQWLRRRDRDGAKGGYGLGADPASKGKAMKHKDPGINWKARKWAAFLVCWLLEKRFGEDAARTWLWSLTPFPATVPRWSEVAFGALAGAAPRRVHDLMVLNMMARIDREIERAMTGVRR
jgi:hypothetical protein